MNVTSTVRRTALVVLVLLTVTAGIAAPVAAQSDADTDTGGNSQADADSAGTYNVDIDDSTRITRADYDGSNKTLTVTIRNTDSQPERVLIAQVIEQGAGRMAFRDTTVYGDNERTFTLRGIPDENGDPAVMVATETSLNQNNGQITWIPTGSEALSETVTLGQGLGIGMITMTLGTVLMAYRKKTKYSEELEDPYEDDGWI